MAKTTKETAITNGNGEDLSITVLLKNGSAKKAVSKSLQSLQPKFLQLFILLRILVEVVPYYI